MQTPLVVSTSRPQALAMRVREDLSGVWRRYGYVDPGPPELDEGEAGTLDTFTGLGSMIST